MYKVRSMRENFFNNTKHDVINDKHIISCIDGTWKVTENTYQEAVDLAVNYFAMAYLNGQYVNNQREMF